jgi:hypothetical protein
MDEQEFALTLAFGAFGAPGIALTGAPKEELKRALVGVDRAIAGDRAYFKSHPNRQHYTRLACEGETAERRLLHPAIPATRLQYRQVLAVVRQVEPGFRQRGFLAYPFEIIDADDADEEEAATLFAEVAGRSRGTP